MRDILTAIMALAFAAAGSAQAKYEREYRIQQEEVPEWAVRYVDSLQFDKKVRWYFEENLKGNSIEAKVRNDGSRHSIEFDTTGNLQDIEIEINWDGIPEAVQDKISGELNNIFERHRIDKIQIQYLGDRTVLAALIKGQEAPGDFITNYEIVVKGKTEEDKNLYEITFDATGEMISLEEIIFDNTDHLEY